MPLFETSAKDDSMCDHVDGIFLTLAHKLVSGRSLIKPVPDPSNPGTQAARLGCSSTIAAPPSDYFSQLFFPRLVRIYQKL